uniref:DUF6445 family protein n=1 Tax=Microbulbifer agarilyticus TaxID=260552 RepID=UPI000255B4A0|nr:DUF6445 family protein [Microbulbifer agarilyticus]
MQVNIEFWGVDRTPVVIIDDLYPDAEQLISTAEHAHWIRENPNYPGIRAQVPADYLSKTLKLAAEAIRQAFGLDLHNGLASAAIRNAFCCFSLVTQPPETLKPIQSLPHFDAVTGQQLAMLHYLCDEPFSGTRFFKHKESGLENVLHEQASAYQTQVGTLLGSVKPGYASQCNEWYEAIGDVAAKFNRVAFYPASLLHSGVVDNGELLSDSARHGRLTITGFIDLASKLEW